MNKSFYRIFTFVFGAIALINLIALIIGVVVLHRLDVWDISLLALCAIDFGLYAVECGLKSTK